MIEKLAVRYAHFIDRNANNPSSFGINKYGAQTLMEFLLFAFIVLLVTATTGDVDKGLLSLAAFAVLRYFSGGLHMESVELCQLLSGGLVLIAVYLPLPYWNVGLVLNVISVIILLFTAPSNIRRSKIDEKYYPILKIIAIMIVSTNFFIQSDLLAKQLFVQSLTALLGFFQKKNT